MNNRSMTASLSHCPLDHDLDCSSFAVCFPLESLHGCDGTPSVYTISQCTKHSKILGYGR